MACLPCVGERKRERLGNEIRWKFRHWSCRRERGKQLLFLSFSTFRDGADGFPQSTGKWLLSSFSYIFFLSFYYDSCRPSSPFIFFPVFFFSSSSLDFVSILFRTSVPLVVASSVDRPFVDLGTEATAHITRLECSPISIAIRTISFSFPSFFFMKMNFFLEKFSEHKINGNRKPARFPSHILAAEATIHYHQTSRDISRKNA